MQLNSKIPEGPLSEKWDKHRFELKLVNPANKRKFKIIVVGTGLAGGSASARPGMAATAARTPRARRCERSAPPRTRATALREWEPRRI